VFNASLTYKNSVSWNLRVRSTTQVTLSYNLFGPRIVALGSQGFPDSYEQAFHLLDLTVKHRFDDSWSLDFKAKNLLDPPAVILAGDLEIERYAKGRSFSFGVKYEF
jgi:outer membrane cobalamin receptor